MTSFFSSSPSSNPVNMTSHDQLVDLSLFASSPTYDQHFSISDVPVHEYYGDPHNTPSITFTHAWPQDNTMKPLPPLPQRRFFPKPRTSTSRSSGTDSRCILTRVKRTRSNESPLTLGDSLPQRRNMSPPPQLTLSAPQANSNPSPASPMVWLPDEQVWLIADEVRRGSMPNQTSYPSPPAPPAYTPRAYARSEPSPTVQYGFDLTPPLTPVQHQLQSLIEPRKEQRPPPLTLQNSREPRDEGDMSPLFQEAMNSVPLMDPADLFPPPSYGESCQAQPVADSRPQTTDGVRPSLSVSTNFPTRSTSLNSGNTHLRTDSAHSRSLHSAVRPSLSVSTNFPTRSTSLNSGNTHLRTDSAHRRSLHSARSSSDLSQEGDSATRWQILARRVARPIAANS